MNIYPGTSGAGAQKEELSRDTGQYLGPAQLLTVWSAVTVSLGLFFSVISFTCSYLGLV